MSTKCPLSDPSLDIIPTNAHLVGNCLCQFCTCGKHLCPRMNFKDPFPRATFTTKYMSEFKKGGFNLPVKPEGRIWRPNKLPMDLITSNQEDFILKDAKPATPIKPAKSATPKKPKISETTINSYNYPDWGTNAVNHEKRWHPPVRTVELPFKGTSSYARSFSPIHPHDAKAFETNYSLSTAYQTSFSLGPKTGFDDRTTYADKMKNYTGSGLNTRIKVRAPKAEHTFSSPMHFNTTTSSFYTTPSQKIDPRQLRIQLQSRGM